MLLFNPRETYFQISWEQLPHTFRAKNPIEILSHTSHTLISPEVFIVVHG
jgi:hypothetical protein